MTNEVQTQNFVAIRGGYVRWIDLCGDVCKLIDCDHAIRLRNGIFEDLLPRKIGMSSDPRLNHGNISMRKELQNHRQLTEIISQSWGVTTVNPHPLLYCNTVIFGLIFFKKKTLSLTEKSKSCHTFQHGIIARGLSTHKFSHRTKPTSKLPVPNAMGQKRSKNKCQ
ncbi:hypothetical protein LXL04_008815 [Taraxacum kok-saghyz]